MFTSELGAGTPNHFMSASCWNPVEPWRKLFLISDPAHALKKPANNLTDQKPYMARSVAALNRDARVVELRFLLKVQLFFDVQLEIEGFLGLLEDQIFTHGSVCLQPRKLSQDTLESMFACVRYSYEDDELGGTPCNAEAQGGGGRAGWSAALH
mmetsp:Transcript_2895/g.4763  ORF Transcript_2895/g.4763 Transcript_2895/m.4763 type:complete len:154 (-) Transcript_2895:13-474(-)